MAMAARWRARCIAAPTFRFTSHNRPQSDGRWAISARTARTVSRILKKLLLAPAEQHRAERFVVAGSKYPEKIRWPKSVDRIDRPTRTILRFATFHAERHAPKCDPLAFPRVCGCSKRQLAECRSSPTTGPESNPFLRRHPKSCSPTAPAKWSIYCRECPTTSDLPSPKRRASVFSGTTRRSIAPANWKVITQKR